MSSGTPGGLPNFQEHIRRRSTGQIFVALWSLPLPPSTMETPINSLQDPQPHSRGRRHKSVDAGMLDVPPLCYKNPNRARRSCSSTSIHVSSIQSTYSPPKATPTQSLSNPSAGGIDSTATDAEERTPVLGSQNLKIKLTKVSPRGSLYELNPAALRLNIPSPICWNRVEEAHSEVPRGNDQHMLEDEMQRSSQKPPSSSTSRSIATFASLNVVARPLKNPASTRGSKRDLAAAAAAELRALTEGAFEWLAEQVLLEGFDIDGNSFDEESSIPSPSVGNCDVWDFSPPTPSNRPLLLLPAPLIVEEHGYVRDKLRPYRTEREIRHSNSSERGFNTSDLQATSSAYSHINTRGFIYKGVDYSTIAVDTRSHDRTPAFLISEQDPQEPSTEVNNGLYLDSSWSRSTYDDISRCHRSSTGSLRTPSPLPTSGPRTQSNLAAISDTTVSSPTFIRCKLERLHSGQAVKAQTPLATMPGRPRANTVDGFVPKRRSIFVTPRKMASKAMFEAVQIVTPCPSLATLSSLARPRALSSPQAIKAATQVSSTTTENTESTFASVGHSNWDFTTTGERVVWAPQQVLHGTNHCNGRLKTSTSMHEASDSFSFPSSSVGPSSPRSGRVPVSPELCKVAKNFSRPTRLL